MKVKVQFMKANRQYFRISVLCLIIFCSSAFPTTGDSSKPDYRFDIRDRKTRSSRTNLSMPLYETKGYDYRTSQSIAQSIRFLNIMTVPVIMIYRNTTPEEDPSIPISFLSSAVLLSGGIIGGAVTGYITGTKYEKEKQRNPFISLERYRFGLEHGFSGSYLKGSDLTVKYYTLSLMHQNFKGSRLFSPSEFRLDFSEGDIYHENDLIESGKVKGISFSVMANSNYEFLQIHYGFGAGYSSVKKALLNDIRYNEINGFSAYPFIGLTASLNDFAVIRIEAIYTISDFYYKLNRHYDNSDYGCFKINFTLGSYIF